MNAGATAIERMMERTRYQHMQVRSGPNNLSVRISVFALVGIAGQWVVDALNTAAEVPLRHRRLAKHPRRRYAR
jgi:protein involved in temperature-dependent protein secretion